MIHLQRLVVAAILLPLLGASARAGVTVEVVARGTVIDNFFVHIPFYLVSVGESATLRFRLDAADVLDEGPTHRAYRIDATSFVFETDSVSVELFRPPFGEGETPHFVLRDDDEGVDGWFVSSAPDEALGLSLEAGGAYDTPRAHLDVDAYGSTLPSTSILDALGSYALSDLQDVHWGVTDSIFQPLTVDLETLEISVVESGWLDEGAALSGVGDPPQLAGLGDLTGGEDQALWLLQAPPNAIAALFWSLATTPTPFKGGVLLPGAALPPLVSTTGPAGDVSLVFSMPVGVPEATELWVQWAVADATAPGGVALSNALRGVTP